MDNSGLASLFNSYAGTGNPALDAALGIQPLTDEEIAAYQAQIQAAYQTPEPIPEQQYQPQPQVEQPQQPQQLPKNLKGGAAYAAPYVQAAAEKWGVPADLLMAQMQAESSFHPKAVSPKGAGGWSQFIPSTWARYAPGKDRSDIAAASEAQAHYMHDLHKMFGDWDLALAGYNAGEGAVQKYGNTIPPYRETQNYVKRIKGLRGNYSDLGALTTAPEQQAAEPQAQSPQIPEGMQQVWLSNGQPLYAPPELDLPTIAQNLQAQGMDAVPLRPFVTPAGQEMHIPFDMPDNVALAHLQRSAPELLAPKTQEQPQVPAGERGPDEGYGAAAASGFRQAAGSIASGLGAEAQELANKPWMPELVGDAGQQVGAWLQEKGAELKERAKTYHRPKDMTGFEEKFAYPLAETAGQVGAYAIPYTVPAVGMLAGTASLYGSSMDTLKARAEQEGKKWSPEEARPYALVDTAVNTLGMKLMGPLKSMLGKEAVLGSRKTIMEIADKQGLDAAKQYVGSHLGNIAKQLGITEAAFTSGEVAEQAIERAYAGLPLFDEEALSEYAATAKQVAPLGFVSGVVKGVGARHVKAEAVEHLKEKQAAEAGVAQQEAEAAQREELANVQKAKAAENLAKRQPIEIPPELQGMPYREAVNFMRMQEEQAAFEAENEAAVAAEAEGAPVEEAPEVLTPEVVAPSTPEIQVEQKVPSVALEPETPAAPSILNPADVLGLNNRSGLRKQLQGLDLNNIEDHPKIDAILQKTSASFSAENSAKLESIMEEVQRAHKVEIPTTPDVSGSAQPGILEEGQGPAIGGEGVRVSGPEVGQAQKVEAPEIKVEAPDVTARPIEAALPAGAGRKPRAPKPTGVLRAAEPSGGIAGDVGVIAEGTEAKAVPSGGVDQLALIQEDPELEAMIEEAKVAQNAALAKVKLRPSEAAQIGGRARGGAGVQYKTAMSLSNKSAQEILDWTKQQKPHSAEQGVGMEAYNKLLKRAGANRTDTTLTTDADGKVMTFREYLDAPIAGAEDIKDAPKSRTVEKVQEEANQIKERAKVVYADLTSGLVAPEVRGQIHSELANLQKRWDALQAEATKLGKPLELKEAQISNPDKGIRVVNTPDYEASTNARELLTQYKQRGTDTELLKLADTILKSPHLGSVGIKWVKTGEQIHPEIAQKFNKGAAAMAAWAEGEQPTIYFRSADPSLREDVLVHEAVHAVTEAALKRNPETAKELKGIAQQVGRSLKEQYGTLHGSKGKNLADFWKKAVDEDPGELLAYGLTSPSFREELSKYAADGRPLDAFRSEPEKHALRKNQERPDKYFRGQAPKELTLWDRFVDAISRLFGLPSKRKEEFKRQLNEYLDKKAKYEQQVEDYNTLRPLQEKLDTAFKELFKETSESGVRMAAAVKENIKLPKEIEVDGVQRSTTDSTGAPIHSTREGIENFWRWFGDSKVVDESGSPLRVYHATSRPVGDEGITEFRSRSHFGTLSTASEFAKGDGAHIYPVYLSIKNPLRIEDTGEQHDQHNLATAIGKALGKGRLQSWDTWASLLKEGGFDGVVYENTREGSGDSYIPLRPGQIKSAIGNKGTFDTTKLDIREAKSTVQKDEEALANVGLAGKIKSKTLPEAMGQFKRDVLSEGRQTSLVTEAIDARAALKEGVKDLPSVVGKKLRADLNYSSLDQRGNVIQGAYHDGYAALGADGTVHVVNDKQLSPKHIFQRVGKKDNAVFTNAAVALRGRTIKKDDRQIFAQANDWLNKADMLEDAAARTKDPKNAKAYTRSANSLRTLAEKNLKDINYEKGRTHVTDEEIALTERVLANRPDLAREVTNLRESLRKYVDLARDAGALTPEQAKAFNEYEDYLPLYKSKTAEEFDKMLLDPMEYIEDFVSHVGRGVNTLGNIKRQKHHDHTVYVEENILRHIAFMTSLAAENSARSNTCMQLALTGGARRVPHKSNKTVMFREKGKDVYYEIDDPAVYAAMHAALPLMSPLLKRLKGMTNFARGVMVVNPLFWFRQLVREPLQASMVGKVGMITPLDTLGAIARIATGKSEGYKKLRSKGVIGPVDVIADPADFIKTAYGEKGLVSRGWSALKHIHEVVDASTRTVVYERAKADGLSKGMDEETASNYATMRARELINFSKQGRSSFFRAMRATTPFFGAALNSMDVMARAAFPKKLGKLSKAEVMEARRNFYSNAATLALYTTAYTLAMSDNDDYLNSSAKRGFWLVPKEGDPDHPFYKIAVNFESGWFTKELPELLTLFNMGLIGKKEALTEGAKGFKELVLPPMPTVFSVEPIIEVMIDHDFYTGGAIDSGRDAHGMAMFRDKKAGELSKLIVKEMEKRGVNFADLSPNQVEHLFKSFFGQMWGLTRAATDAYLYEGPPQVDKSMWDYPLASGMVAKASQDKNVNMFLETYHDAAEVEASYTSAQKFVDVDKFNLIKDNPEYKKSIKAQRALEEDYKTMGEIKNQLETLENLDRPSAIKTQQKRDLEQKYRNAAREGVRKAKALGLEM